MSSFTNVFQERRLSGIATITRHRRAGTTTGDMSRAGTPSRRARKPTGRVIGKPRPSGRLTTHENRRPATRHRSRSSACSGPSTTTRATSTIRSSALALRSLPASRRGAGSTGSRDRPPLRRRDGQAVGRLHRQESHSEAITHGQKRSHEGATTPLTEAQVVRPSGSAQAQGEEQRIAVRRLSAAMKYRLAGATYRSPRS